MNSAWNDSKSEVGCYGEKNYAALQVKLFYNTGPDNSAPENSKA